MSNHFDGMSPDEIRAEKMRIIGLLDAQRPSGDVEGDVASHTELRDLVREAERLLGQTGKATGKK